MLIRKPMYVSNQEFNQSVQEEQKRYVALFDRHFQILPDGCAIFFKLYDNGGYDQVHMYDCTDGPCIWLKEFRPMVGQPQVFHAALTRPPTINELIEFMSILHYGLKYGQRREEVSPELRSKIRVVVNDQMDYARGRIAHLDEITNLTFRE